MVELSQTFGQYDCLSLNTVDGIGIADLNRVGRFHTHNQLRDNQDSNSPAKSGKGVAWDIWPEALAAADLTKLVDSICHRIGLEVPAKLPPSTPIVLVYRFITEFLSRTAFARDHWECRSGFYDSSGGSGGVCSRFFAAFPAAEERRRVRSEEPWPENPAYRFWFILRNSEPVLCLETTGTIWNLAGDSLDIPKTYKLQRRLWPLITEIAGDLLP